MVYPAKRNQTPIYLAGKYTLQGLADAIESQTNGQAFVTGKIIRLTYPQTDRFTLIEPNIFANQSTANNAAPGVGTPTPQSGALGSQNQNIPGDTITQIDGYAIIQGPLKNLSVTRRILNKLMQPPREIRLTAILINDNISNDIDLQITPGANPITLANINEIWTGATATINILRQRGAIVTAYQAILTAGETENYTDTDQRVVQQYTTTGESTGTGTSLLNSGLGTRTAGLTITVTANPGPGYWTITGSVGNSTFSGTSALADELGNTISWTSTIAPGEMQRVTEVTVTNTDHTIGVSTDSPTYNHDGSNQQFSLWVRLQKIQPDKIIFLKGNAK